MESAGLARGLKWRVFVLFAAAASALSPVPPGFIDRYYSAGIYPPLQRFLTTASNVTSIPALDLLIVVTAGVFLVSAWRDVRSPGGWQGVMRIARRGLVISAVVYLAFIVTWGLNYRRVPVVDALRFEKERVTTDSAKQAAAMAVERVNALHDAAHTAGWPSDDAIDPNLADGLRRAVLDLGRGAPIVPARPKKTMLDWYFRGAGVDGMTDPFFLETLIATDVLPFERPFVVAHEWGHLAGFADEGDANFVGWLACMRSTPSAQYSGWLFLYSQIAQSIGSRAAAPIAENLAEGPRADLRAIRDRIARQVNPRVAAAGWRAYDAYLKVNRVEAGTNSYAEVVRLALGVRLPSGEPALALQ